MQHNSLNSLNSQSIGTDEQRFHQLADVMPHIVFAADSDGSITYVNRFAKEYAGLETEGLGQGWVMCIHPGDRELATAIWQQAIQTGQPYEIECRFRRADGTYRWSLSRGSPVQNNQGQIIEWVCSSVEIHDGKKAEADREQALIREQALREQAEATEARLQQILTSIREDFVLLDRNWNVAYLNDQAAETMQQPAEVILGKSFWQIFPDLVGTELYDRLHQVMHDRVPIQFEYYYPKWDCWFENRTYPTPDGIVILSTNITARKRVELIEAELRQTNAILDAVNQSAPTPIFVKDRDGRIIYANPATLEVLGKTAEEVIGYRDCDLYLHLEDAIAVMENDQRIMESGEMEVVEESPDGIRTFLGMKAPYRNQQGEVIGLIGISNDITDRVQLERDREQLLLKEQAAREAAEQANRIKDEFLAVISHELRTPLNPILGWIKLIQQGKVSADQIPNALSTIERNAKLQAQLIDDLLDISRILRGKLSLHIFPVNLQSVISSAIETVRLAAEAKSMQIETHYSPLSGSVMGDAARLQQVLWNLLSNAVKFTPERGHITITLTQVGHHAQIQVIDTGKGIHPDFLPYVFEHFRQEDGATTRKFGGLGLGLAIARQMVELHGGMITVESLGEDQGATFTVRIPLTAAPDEADRTQSPFECRSSPLQSTLTSSIVMQNALEAIFLEHSEPDAIFSALLPVLGEVLKCDRIFLYLRNPITRIGHSPYCWRRSSDIPDVTSPELKREPESLAQEDPLFAAALAAKPSIYVEDVETADPTVVNSSFEQQTFGHRALIHGHLRQDGMLWGILQPCVFGQPRVWTAFDHNVMNDVEQRLTSIAIAYVQQKIK